MRLFKMSFYTEITDLILSKKIQSKEELHKTKIKLCKKYKIDSIPADSEILAKLPDVFSDEEMETMVSLLRKKSMRTISGVAIVAVMTSPEECPHGLCGQHQRHALVDLEVMLRRVTQVMNLLL